MKSEIKDGVLIITVEENMIGTITGTPIMNAINSALESGTKKVVISLIGATITDSTGLGILLSSTSKIANAGGELVLCHVPEQTKKLFIMTKLGNTFHQQTDLNAALIYLAAK